MIVSTRGDRLTIKAPAKVNLHLEVLGKRADGYHEIETLMVSVSLYDTLVFRVQPSGTSVRCSERRLGTGEENLVTRAIATMRDETGRSDGIRVTLTKRIPLSAGLAGGSTDAAATLEGLNRLWRLGWSRQKLVEVSARLGSDVPFFFYTPAAIGRGRGDELERFRLGRPLYLVLVCPPEGLSTAAVYRAVKTPKRPVSPWPLVAALRTGSLATAAQRLHNRLESPATRLSPLVDRLLRSAERWDCLGYRMSGSGSAVFALCASANKARQLGRRLRTRRLGRVFVVRTCH
jgi:4-diphosphocytidyl-2-C-methyl-D-erythritol kinase